MPRSSFPKIPKYTKTDLNRYRHRASIALYKENEGNDFVILDGPPFANGSLHIGHFLNRTLKDMALRTAILQGQKVRMRPGWDCHGLPTEMRVEANSVNKSDPVEFRRKCRESAHEAIEQQVADMRDWSLLGDYERPYKTMDKEYEANQLLILVDMVERGLMFRAKKPVHWSPSSRSALAEAELEYVERADVAAFVSFPLVGEENVHLLIWTTTPWTLPANQAIAINSDIEYCLVKIMQRKVIVSVKSIQSLKHTFGSDVEVVRSVDAKWMLWQNYKNPFNQCIGPVLHADFVGEGAGTGLVHIAPSHGQDDFELCRLHGINPVDIVDEHGRYRDVADLSGIDIFDKTAASIILDKFRTSDSFVLVHKFTHSCPVDWRTKQPTFIRATEQWFIDIANIKADLLKAVEDAALEVKAQTGKESLKRFIANRTEWCISRQRLWGVPIPVFYERDTGKPLFDVRVIRHIAEIFREHGSDAWWTHTVSELLPEEYRTQAHNWVKSMETMDVWFDSGTAWSGHSHANATVIEGDDQYRGWFQSSLITSIAARSDLPFRRIISHGFVLDESLRKMSKSLGNVVAPNEAIGKYGLDTTRMWVAGSAFWVNVAYSEKQLGERREQMNRIRNTFRFILGNLSGYDKTGMVLKQFDQVAVGSARHIANAAVRKYADFRFKDGLDDVVGFIADLSALYLNGIKDRLYVYRANSIERRSAQAALHDIALNLALTLSPITPILVCEVSEHLKTDLFRLSLTKNDTDAADYAKLKRLLELKRELTKLTDIPLPEADVIMPATLSAAFSTGCLKEALQCSHLSFGSNVVVRKTPLHKCERCVTFSATVADELCNVCQSVISAQCQ